MVQLQADEVMLVIHEGVHVAKDKHGCIKKKNAKRHTDLPLFYDDGKCGTRDPDWAFTFFPLLSLSVAVFNHEVW